MRLSIFFFSIAGCFAANVAAQCPIQFREATIEATANKVVIRYYNSGVRPVRDVHFILTKESTLERQSIISKLTARGIVLPTQDRSAVFPKVATFPPNFSFAVEVSQVSFDDDETWTSTKQGQCTVLLSRQ